MGESHSEQEPLTVEQVIANLQQREDLGLRYYAAWWLGKFRVNESAAIDALLAALEDEADRSPDGGYPLRRNAARALGKLDAPRAVPALIGCLDNSDYYVREAAAQSLEELGDTSCTPVLMKLLDGGVAAAQPVPGKPHLVQPYEAVLEALGTLQASEAVPQIQPFLDHPTEKVQYAAARAMYQLSENPVYGERLVQALQEDRLPLRRSALMDLGAIGYLPAAEAIAKTPAENSLKLISLKGLLEHHLESNLLSEKSIEIMNLMDSLL
ncbi:MAG: phycocyanobilin lyase [Cyanobacteria bacterium QH_8_48_120]|jgi:phycocyanobilin lyase alpha subunit|nr:MAG: phycocyanobilin lyase [Cyanobacteria bacterium QH_1_48_107]PSO59671.1 MAG: phycocyanobilin lyase [Cyanobacteria bacterium QH_10_48_56]PSO60337.1 MAG: phycocyanobilin lyase [Cyanobacteria bacterium QH_2_48_84]PSO61406.1 MAG: phycocyanobilin lyase [Cyanobacteria bacterium QH_7_48_89]PSO62835.1 MAG: phycocyanobilin lyase [Cyanobacteria bacterium QH_6_48_35]PSO67455.1 MAG: phycocyanobilin lyase [Cyanobacteria bacterium QS_1_48_34]PSO68813.1 MAG: phycocyanobilin lyase [Cyanobacteria bacter